MTNKPLFELEKFIDLSKISSFQFSLFEIESDELPVQGASSKKIREVKRFNFNPCTTVWWMRVNIVSVLLSFCVFNGPKKNSNSSQFIFRTDKTFTA